MRTCIGCRSRAEQTELLRVVAQDGVVVFDEGRVLPGRGAWLHPRRTCLASAEKKRAFTRALRASGQLDASPLREMAERLMDN